MMRMRRLALPVSLACLMATVACPVLTGCVEATFPAAGTAPDGPRPPYAGESLSLFDDAIDPHAVGLELQAKVNPKSDPQVRARALASDVVLRARVATVTGEAGSGARSYQLIFKTVERVAGKHPVGDEFTLRVEQTSPSIGIVRSMEGQLVGKTLVVYVKSFSRPDGQSDLHFHASADEPDLIAAVQNLILANELK
jgi:hypothetical protein